MKKFLLVLLGSILLFSNIKTPTVLGCAINLGDSWYAVTVKVISNPLSDILGVSFSDNGELITLTNRGIASNLYIGSKDTDGLYPGYREFQRDYRPKEEIFGKEFEPNVLISVGDGMPKGTYVFHGGWDDNSVIRTKSTSNSETVVLSSVLDRTDNYKSRQRYADDRPGDAPIPEPDYQTMYVFYNGGRYNIDIVLNYSLKNNYNPNKVKNSCSGSAEAAANIARKRELTSLYRGLYAAMASILLILVAILFVIKNKKNKKALSKKIKKQKTKINRRK